MLAELLEPISHFTDAQTEFTVEANPGTVNSSLAKALGRMGVNRVSVGIQSFDDNDLKFLSRIHSAKQAIESWELLRQAGLKNLSLDLIFGIPDQSIDSWRRSLQRAISLNPYHISCYALSVEPGTKLAHLVRTGDITEVDGDFQRSCYDLARNLLAEAGLEHYEISNFALPSRQCRHNLLYWHNASYVGLGPSAVSYVNLVRSKTSPSLDDYLQAVETGSLVPVESESLKGRKLMAETLILALRLTQGINIKAFTKRFGIEPAKAFPRSVEKYQRLGALEISENSINLASRYLFVSNPVFCDILSEV